MKGQGMMIEYLLLKRMSTTLIIFDYFLILCPIIFCELPKYLVSVNGYSCTYFLSSNVFSCGSFLIANSEQK